MASEVLRAAARESEQPILQRAPIKDGEVVFAPVKDYELYPAKVRDALGRGKKLQPGFRAVQFDAIGRPHDNWGYSVPTAELVPAAQYFERLVDGCRAEADSVRADDVWIWRVETHKEGLFSLVFLALGFLEHTATAQPGARLMIDWTDERICFHGHGAASRGCANAWNHFFEQPVDGIATGMATEAPGAAALQRAMNSNGVMLVTRFGKGWFQKLGEFRGADEGKKGSALVEGGRLDPQSATRGRDAFRRWIKIRPRVLERAEAAQRASLDSSVRWLAVHVRQTDKVLQCPANAIEHASLEAQTVAFCAALACGGVLLCTDDAALKRRMKANLSDAGLRVATFSALLSADDWPSHKDRCLDRRQNAEDCLVEVLLMSRCHALLSTWSNVSVATVYLSPPEYRHYMFGDTPPVRRPPPPTTTRSLKSEISIRAAEDGCTTDRVASLSTWGRPRTRCDWRRRT